MKSISASRVVAVLTPIVSAGIAVGDPWLVKYTGLKISASDLTALTLGGIASVVVPATTWLIGHSKWERAQLARVGSVVDTVAADADKADPGIVAKIETAVKAELDRLAPKVLEAVGAPADAWPGVEKVADEVVAAADAPAPAVTEPAPAAVPVA